MEKKQEKKSLLPLLILVIIFSPIIAILVSLILGFIILISPMVTIGFIFYSYFNYKNDIHRRQTNYNYDIKQLENV